MPPDERPVIERATAADVETIADHWVDLAREQRGYGSHVLPEANRGAITDLLGAHRVNGGLLVARAGDDVTGFATFTIERGSIDLDVTRGVLSNLYVRPPYRNRGVGSALVAAVESELASRDVSVVTLEVMADNDAAKRFYRRNGYGEHRVTMERRLDGDDENDTHTKQRG